MRRVKDEEMGGEVKMVGRKPDPTAQERKHEETGGAVCRWEPASFSGHTAHTLGVLTQGLATIKIHLFEVNWLSNDL